MMLQNESVNATHHHDDVKNNEKRGHRPAEAKSAVQENEWNRQQRQPDMRAQPALQCADAPEHQFFSDTKQRGKDKDRQCDRAKDKTERRATDAPMFRWPLD